MAVVVDRVEAVAARVVVAVVLMAMAVKGGDAGRHTEGLVAARGAGAGGERGAVEAEEMVAEARTTVAAGKVVAAGARVEAVRARVAAETAMAE